MALEKWLRITGRLLGWISAILILLMLITGYGVTDYRFFNTLTFGLWSKASSQQWHEWWGIPLLMAVCAHVIIAQYLKSRYANQKEKIS